eukprot:4232058-Pyramimonas_sp.AAC.1
MVKFRGKHAAQCWGTFMSPEGRYIDLPHSEFLAPELWRLSVVSCYKHLGVKVAADRNDFQDARRKASSALHAFVPLATK